ncbi:hypothetical protein Bca4012_027803 [Brassica carinata]
MMVPSSFLNLKAQVALRIQLDDIGSGFSTIESTVAFKFIGWAAEISSLVDRASVTFYSYTLFSLTLQHHALLGHRYLRFQDGYGHHIYVNSLVRVGLVVMWRNRVDEFS